MSKRKDFKLQMKMNDEVFKCSTDNLREAILSFAPKVLKTRILFRIESKKGVCERQIFVHRGKMLFRSDLFLDTFIQKLIYK